MIFELRSIVHGRFVISMGNFAGLWHSEEESMPEAGLRRLGQGSWIRTRSRGAGQGQDTEFQKQKLRLWEGGILSGRF